MIKKLMAATAGLSLMAITFAMALAIGVGTTNVYADGNGSSSACLNTTPGVEGSVTNGTSSQMTYTAGAGFVVTGVCIKSGSNMFGGNQHSAVLGNGNYESNCYTVSGVGTQTVTVTRNGSGPNCQGLSHIDVVLGQAPQPVDYCDPSQRPRGKSIKQWVPNSERCVEPWTEVSCGVFNGGVTNRLTGPSWTQNYALVWSEGAPDYNQFVTPPAQFAEDYNGGSVEVFYWVVGPEADYVTDRNIPNYWEQNAASVTVDTDCKGTPGSGSVDPTEPTKPTTASVKEKEAEKVASLPTASGSGEAAALISLSTLSVLTIAGALVRRHFSALSL